MEVVVLSALILLNGAFAMSEIGLVMARRGQLRELSEHGDAGATAALALAQEPTRFLSTIQIGITTIGILNGIVGEAALAPPLAQALAERGMEARAAGWVATGLVVVAITYFSIVLGELVPKRLGQLNPEAVARRVARPMQWLARASMPFVRVLSVSTAFVLRVFGVRDAGAPRVTEEEIRALLLEGAESGAIEEEEHEMVRNVFRLDDRLLGSLMVPRRAVVTLDVDLPWEENLRRIEESEHARFPVLKGGWREILGVVSARQLLGGAVRGEKVELRSGLQPPVYVPGTLTGMELLQHMRSSHVQLVFVADEYGEVEGIVTLQDVLEAITGEFKPRTLEEQWAVRRDDGSWLFDGMTPAQEFQDRLALRELPEEGRYHTLAGMVLLLAGRVPAVGEAFSWGGWRFEAVDMDGRRIDRVLASREAPAPGESTP